TFANESVNLSSYQLVNTNISYSLIKNRLNVFGAVSNIFNEDFQENIGYNTRGRNFKLGLNLSF
ncbi:MAG: TonB-dependent receptor, partial [Flavobacterium sp.]|nr:TonB-dependent receptor [Flavobacterium sp.]